MKYIVQHFLNKSKIFVLCYHGSGAYSIYKQILMTHNIHNGISRNARNPYTYNMHHIQKMMCSELFGYELYMVFLE